MCRDPVYILSSAVLGGLIASSSVGVFSVSKSEGGCEASGSHGSVNRGLDYASAEPARVAVETEFACESVSVEVIGESRYGDVRFGDGARECHAEGEVLVSVLRPIHEDVLDRLSFVACDIEFHGISSVVVCHGSRT